MIKIPDNVEEWDIGLITKLIHEGYDENEILEFKSTINEDTKKIPITACAFANTHGGTIVLGVNNDRTKSLSLDQRLIGLEDSDDLKSKITNQLKNIKPDILLSNVQFKESNIKLSWNGRVIVIVRISKSKGSPHQFEYKFYKRLANGNELMDVEEIRNKILDSEKNATLLTLFFSEGGFLRAQVQSIKNHIDVNNIHGAMQTCRYLNSNATTHFLYHQSHLYSEDIQSALMKLVEIIRKMISLRESVDELMNTDPKVIQRVFEKDDSKTVEEWAKKLYYPLVTASLSEFDKLEELFAEKFPEPFNYNTKPPPNRS